MCSLRGLPTNMPIVSRSSTSTCDMAIEQWVPISWVTFMHLEDLINTDRAGQREPGDGGETCKELQPDFESNHGIDPIPCHLHHATAVSSKSKQVGYQCLNDDTMSERGLSCLPAARARAAVKRRKGTYPRPFLGSRGEFDVEMPRLAFRMGRAGTNNHWTRGCPR